MGGSLPPGLPTDAFNLIAYLSGLKSVIDADGDALREGLKADPFLVKPNAREAERLLGGVIRTHADALAAAHAIRKLGAGNVIVSLGAEGLACACADGDYIAIPPAIDARSTIGSGDSLVAGVLVALSREHTWREALRLGTAAGAATATTDGAAIGSRETVDRLLSGVEVREA
jgi:fructose-1-phosphate kinase PfkB-like protein